MCPQVLSLKLLQTIIVAYIIVDVVKKGAYMRQEVLMVGWLCCLLTVEAIGAKGDRQSGGAIGTQ